MRLVLALLALPCALFASSCLVIEPPSAHMTAPVPADDVCTRYAETFCDGFTRCCDDPAIVAMAPDRATCVRNVQTNCTSGAINLSTLVHDRRTGYDPMVGGAVLGTLQDYMSACDPSVVVWLGRRDGLDSALLGTVGNGQPCLNGNPISEYPAFLSCEDFSQACILSSLTMGNCNARHPLGGTCVLDFDCQDGLYCASAGGLAHMCAPVLANGAPCNDGSNHDSWCQSSFCYMGRCEAPTRTHVYCGAGM